MKTTSDRQLAKSCKGQIDLILGGHDHESIFEEADDKVTLIKSGQDFQEFSDIKVIFNGDGTTKVERTQVLMDVRNYGKEEFSADPEIQNLIKDFQEKEDMLKDQDLAYFEI